MFIVLVGFYGYILWTFVLSFTTSTFLPSYKWAGLAQYERLFDNDRWWVASKNLALFGGMFIGITLVIGVLLAVFLDQRIRREGFIRTIYLYPMALSLTYSPVYLRARIGARPVVTFGSRSAPSGAL